MSLAHARRFLCTLYASDKEGRRDAGRFGVGFWSVLRFEPSRIAVRSWPRRGAPWEILLSGDLAAANQGTPPPCPFAGGHGTEVALERPGEDRELLRRVRDAAWQSARFVSRRDDPRRPLDLQVNGVSAVAPFALPRPSASFRRGRHRGVVALGREARVELFARGLRVRSAAALHDLTGAATSAARVRFPEIDGLVPQALLDGDDLEPLLARSDVRDDRSLRRLLGLAEGALAHLVERQLALARPESVWRRASRLLALAAVLATGAAAGRLAWPARETPQAAEASAGRALAPGRLLEGMGPLPFRDPSIRYAGPRASLDGGGLVPPLLFYRPVQERPYLAALLMDDVYAHPAPARRSGPYLGGPCVASCLEVTLLLEGGPGFARLPRATGHLVDPASLRVGDGPAALGRGTAGEPVLELPHAGRWMVSYRSGLGLEPVAEDPPVSAPSPVVQAAAAMSGMALEARAAAAVQWVRERVRYSTAEADVARHRAAEAVGEDVVARTLRIGAGDCDVQNAVLTVLMRSAGVRARLAVGHVGGSGGGFRTFYVLGEL